MKEDFLHYLWKFKYFNTLDLKTTSGESITIVNVGQYLEQAGPDFFNAQIRIDNQKWAGNVEMHLKSSDWYIHHHENDPAYENVILHVVWEHDVAIYRSDNSIIPVLELKHYVAPKTVINYNVLRSVKSWLYCENQLAGLDQFLLRHWQERLFVERLEQKTKPISNWLTQTSSDWEAVFFWMLSQNFGLNTNGDQFFAIVSSIPFSIIRKEASNLANIEALLFGNAGLLDTEKEDHYFTDLKFRYTYLLQKYQLTKPILAPVQFFKHRPDNFPTIRLSQLAVLWHTHSNLFSKICATNSLDSMYQLLQVTASPYWLDHYQFDKLSPKKNKQLSKPFMDLLIVNTIVPIRFTYAQSHGKDNSQDLVDLLQYLSPEKNGTIDKFNYFGIATTNAFETQSLLQLKKEYCNKSKCLSCAIGIEVIKNI